MDYKLNINGKYGFRYGWLLPYYPKRYEVSEELNEIREIIYAFKDGNLDAKKVSIAFKEEIIGQWIPRSEWYLTPIPSSNPIKTKNRFRDYITNMVEICGFKDGFSLINNIDSWEPIHTSENRESTNILEHIIIGDVKGKCVLLTDDVITTGRTFKKIANVLIEKGALKVEGFFIGKTHWLEDE